jgi:hypothetical protein
MQTQQRAENGITEIIIGYVGEEELEQTDEVTDLTTLSTEFMGAGNVFDATLDGLPDDVRSVILAEQHRKESGTVLPSTFYQRNKSEK